MLSKTLFSKCDISACLPLPSIFGPIMETCVYLSLLPRIPNLPASYLYFQTAWLLPYHELYILVLL